jgi:hypothetical protein
MEMLGYINRKAYPDIVNLAKKPYQNRIGKIVNKGTVPE